MATGSINPYIVLSSVFLVIGLLGLAAGWIGWRSGTRPHCRACNFDLGGLTAPARCPECGRELASAGAVRTGRRRRRPAFIVAGAVLAMAGVGVGAYRLLGVSVYPYLPTAALLAIADSRDPARADRVVDELRARLDAGSLSAGEASTIVDLALDVQSDSARAAWSDAWADLLAVAATGGLLDEPRMARLLTHGVELSVTHRTRLIAGRDVSLQVSIAGARLPKAIRATVTSSVGTLRLAGVEVVLTAGVAEPRLNVGAGGASSYRIPLTVPGAAAAGPADLETRMVVVIVPGEDDAARIKPLVDGALPPGAVRVERTFRQPVEVLPAGTPLTDVVAWNTDASLEDAVRAAVSIDSIDSTSGGLLLYLAVKAPPVGLAFRVLVAGPGAEHGEIDVGTASYAPGATHHIAGIGASAAVGWERADVRLAPDLAAAYRDSFVTEVWCGEVRIDGVVLAEVNWGSPALATSAKVVPPQELTR